MLGFVKEFFELVGYTYGLDYEVVAFQAVNTADLGGKTMHKAFGWKGKGERVQEGAKREAHKRMAHSGAGSFWTKISLVDAKLLAQAEKDLRQVIPVNNPWKTKDGQVRPFAGVNVIFTGDFHQLPPRRASTLLMCRAPPATPTVRKRLRMPWVTTASS